MKHFLKRMSALLLSFILCLSLSGCGKIFDTVSPSEDLTYAQLPKPEREAFAAPVGDERASDLLRPVIYYAGPDGEMMIPRTRVISMTAQEDLNRRLAEEVLNTPTTGAIPVAPKDSRILFTETGNGHVTICVQPSADLSANEHFLLSSSLTQTIYENTSVTGVSLLINGRAMSASALPLGVITPSSDIISLMNEPAPAQDGSYTRNVALYLPGDDRVHLLTTVKTLTVSRSDPALSVLTALTQAKDVPHAFSLRLNAETAFEKPSVYTIAADGSRILNLYLTESALTSLSSAPHTLNQAFASITLTLTTFLPATDGVSIHFPSGQVTEIIRATGEKKRCEDGVLTRSCFAALIGTPVSIYFANESGHLSAETRICPVTDALSVRTRLHYLLEGPVSSGHFPVVPSGILQTDFAGIRVAGGIAHINLSGEIYRRCQAFSEREETLFVYSLVNTLCELDSVSGVRFYVEGETVPLLTQYIHLESVLQKNPGLVSER